MFDLHCIVHKVDITEGASVQFPTWIFNFWPHMQWRAVREPSQITFAFRGG